MAGKKFLVFFFLFVYLTLVPCFAVDRTQGLTARQIISQLYSSPTNKTPLIDIAIAYTARMYDKEGALNKLGHGKVYFKKPALTRTEITYDDGTPLTGTQFYTFRDGKTKLIYVQDLGQPVKIDVDDGTPNIYLPFNLPVYAWHANREYILLGSEKLEQREVVVIALINKADMDKSITKVWVDKERLIPLKVEIRNLGEKKGQAKNCLILFSKVICLPDGRWMHTLIDISQEGRPMFVIDYTSISVNNNLAETLFRPSKYFR